MWCWFRGVVVVAGFGVVAGAVVGCGVVMCWVWCRRVVRFVLCWVGWVWRVVVVWVSLLLAWWCLVLCAVVDVLCVLCVDCCVLVLRLVCGVCGVLVVGVWYVALWCVLLLCCVLV